VTWLSPASARSSSTSSSPDRSPGCADLARKRDRRCPRPARGAGATEGRLQPLAPAGLAYAAAAQHDSSMAYHSSRRAGSRQADASAVGTGTYTRRAVAAARAQ
jgi:hypothetical protein